jgi:hypothetical protein
MEVNAMKWFNSLENMNWTRMWWIIGMLSTFWIGLATQLPETWYKPVSVILTALQSALLFASRGTKYVAQRTDPPADGKP